jgi:RNA polymerase sigma-70 factor (ECF subfamily)
MIRSSAQPSFTPTIADVGALADSVLVERARAGDAAAFELIMRRYNQRLYRLARGILRNGAEAEDAVQETYLRAYEKLADFVGPTGFASWLGRIVINEALGRLRKSGRVVSLDDYVKGPAGAHADDVDQRWVETMQSALPDPERLAASGELRRLLETAIDGLPDDFRAVFILRAIDGMNVAETAACLAIRPETVKTRFHRARRLLQDDLGQKFEALMPAAFAFGGAHCDRITAAVLAKLAPAFTAAQRRSGLSD